MHEYISIERELRQPATTWVEATFPDQFPRAEQKKNVRNIEWLMRLQEWFAARPSFQFFPLVSFLSLLPRVEERRAADAIIGKY